MQEIEIYINDTLKTKVNTNKVGTYKTNLILPETKENKNYSIKVKTNKENKELYATTQVQYSREIPVVESFKMQYEDTTYELLTNNKKVVTFIPGRPIQFEVKFTNHENVKDVYVTSTRDQVTKRIKAQWNEEKQAFITNKPFDSDTSYVPGKMNVYYTDKNNMLQNIEDIEIESEMINNISKDTQVKIISNTSKQAEIQITLKDNNVMTLKSREVSLEEGLPDIVGKEAADKILNNGIARTRKKVTTREISSISDVIVKFLKDVGKKNVKKVIQDGVETVYYQEWRNGDLVSYIIDTEKGIIKESYISNFAPAIITWKLDEEYPNMNISDKTGKCCWDFITNSFKAFDKLSGNLDDLTSLYMQVYRSNRPEEEKQEIYELISEYKQQNKIIFAAKTGLNVVELAAGLAGVVTLSPLGIVLAVSTYFVKDILLDMYEKDLDYKIEYLKGNINDSSIMWAIDPSGYVYEAVTNNRLEGVKCEAYYLDETGNEILWNANEYDQENPLYTDQQGNYMWDVPEGKWKVKYTLKGYEIASTDWLDVPPPQTEVNIGLISLEKPTVTLKENANNQIILEFSKYMIPDSVKNIIIKNKDSTQISYTLEYSKQETNIEGTVYAKQYILKTSQELKSNCYIEIPTSVKSYAEVEINPTTLTLQKENLIGDINGDGEVNMTDLGKLNSHIRNKKLLTGEELERADINKDGQVNMTDLGKLNSHIRNKVLLW